MAVPLRRAALAGGLFLVSLGFTGPASGAGDAGSIRVHDPYAGGSGRWLRGQVHAHSTTHRSYVSADSLRDKVERYRDAGYDFVCITDHNQPSRVVRDDVAPLPTRDPGVEGIHFISGAEIGFVLPGTRRGNAPARRQHLGGIGMDWSVGRGDSLFRLAEVEESTAQAAIDLIRTMRYAADREALVVINHPEMEDASAMLRFLPGDLAPLHGMTGIEVYNTKWARARPGGRSWQSHGASHWDFLLARSDGPCWGFATDDAHAYVPGVDFLGGWILVQADSVSTVEILDAVRAGRFVACVDSCAGATRDGASARFTRLGSDGRRIRAESDRPTEFTWWSDFGHMVRRTSGVTSDTYPVEGWERHVRVRIRNDQGAAYSQPFRVENPDRDADRWRLRPEPGTRVLLHLEEGEGPIAEDVSGTRSHLLLERPFLPSPDRWLDRADTVAYRDSLWGGWLHNGVGTTPDETDVDRDRSGYALRAHGRSLRGEIPVRPGSFFLEPGPFTLEWIGAIERRIGDEQPLLVNESADADDARRGWRLVVAPAGAEGAYRFRWYAENGEARTLEFGEDVEVGAMELVAVVRGPDRVEAYVGGRLVAESSPVGPIVSRAAAPPRETAAFVAFADPGRPEAGTYFVLRELRLGRGVRTAAAIAEDAARLDLAPATARPEGDPPRR